MKMNMRGRGLLAAAGIAVLGAGFTAPAWARTNHAVLVAVTAYPNLPPRLSLIGPNHDAALVRDYLVKDAPAPFEPANVSVLATGLDGATAEPTRENILSTLAGVAAKAKPDDFVYLHFSGHGAQQPTLTPETEIDGKDEIFLPSDSMPWDDKAKRIPNALLDDEIGAALDAIRATGAFVWVVFDACHSGSVTRAAVVGDDIKSADRKASPEDLGIPAEEMANAEAASRDLGETDRTSGFKLFEEPAQPSAEPAKTAAPAKEGAMVAFFAARTVETTPEMPLPKGAENAERLGLFTFTLFSKLAQNPGMTYRQLGHSVLQQYAADGRPNPTPIFEGELDALDAPVFGTEGGDSIMQWRVATADGALTIPAGRLHGLAQGTRLALLPGPGSKLSETLGYVEVTGAENVQSRLAPVAAEGKPALKPTEIPPTAYARLGEIAIDFTLKVARPSPAEGLDKEVALVNSTLDALAAAKEEKHINIELVDAGAEADLRLAVLRESEIEGAAPGASSEPALWFLPPSGEIALVEGRRPPLVAIDSAVPEKLAEATGSNLQKIFRATSLAKLATAPGGVPDTVTVNFQIKRAGKGTLEALDEATVPRVAPKDQVHIEATNNSTKPVDINILYLGSDYSITQIGQGRRLEAGDTLKKGLLAFTADSFGMERMIAVVTQAPPQSPVEDLGFLAQGKVPTATRSVGGGISAFRAALTDIGMASPTRSVMTLDEEDDQGAVMMFSIETAPSP